MRVFPLKATAIAAAFMAIGGPAMADGNEFCATGTISSDQQRIDCAGRWISADGTRFGPQIDPRDTPRTAHPGFRNRGAAQYGHTSTSRHYTTRHAATPAPVWTPPQPYTEPYTQPYAPVVVTRGNHTNTYGGTADVYVQTQLHHQTQAPLRPAPHQGCNGHQNNHASTGGHHGGVYCGAMPTAHYPTPANGCFTIDAAGRSHAIACPSSGYAVQSRAQHYSSASASAHATASANVNISNAGFFNGLSGGVGGGGTTFIGGGGGGFVSSGGGSVLSRAPLVRFRSHNRGHKGGGGGKHHCGGCGGGKMGGGKMGGGGH